MRETPVGVNLQNQIPVHRTLSGQQVVCLSEIEEDCSLAREQARRESSGSIYRTGGSGNSRDSTSKVSVSSCQHESAMTGSDVDVADPSLESIDSPRSLLEADLNNDFDAATCGHMWPTLHAGNSQ